MLIHLGHDLGLSSDSMTYMRQWGHPTRTMDVTPGLFGYPRVWPWSVSLEFSSVDTHELGGDVSDKDGETDIDRFGDSILNGLARGGKIFSFNSCLGPFLFRLIALRIRKKIKISVFYKRSYSTKEEKLITSRFAGLVAT